MPEIRMSTGCPPRTPTLLVDPPMKKYHYHMSKYQGLIKEMGTQTNHEDWIWIKEEPGILHH
jgi:hypothetical protein